MCSLHSVTPLNVNYGSESKTFEPDGVDGVDTANGRCPDVAASMVQRFGGDDEQSKQYFSRGLIT